MADFKMCPACQAEYDDPTNRRFHAQPNACPVCGPRVWLVTPDGAEIPSSDPVAETIDRLLAGEIMAIKGIGGFHLAVDATNESAVMRLRERKHRYGKPLAIMVRDLDAARGICALTPRKRTCCSTVARPIVLSLARGQTAALLHPSRRESRGWASFFPTRHCSICSLPMPEFERW